MAGRRHHLSRRLAVAAVAVALAAAGAAVAQEAAPADEPAAAEAGVTSYPAAFFAEFRPVNAMDMLGKVPAFSFDGGSQARGMSGTVGNVLIDGERPPSRSDSLQAVLGRIPASQIVRIDVVRGGAGGIDMGGKPVVANVILKSGGGVKGVVAGNARVDEVGVVSGNAQLQLNRRANGRALDGSLSLNRNAERIENRRLRLSPGGVVLQDSRARGHYQGDSLAATAAYEGDLAGGRIRANGLLNINDNRFTRQDTLLVPGGLEDLDDANNRTSGEAGLRYTRRIAGANLELVAFQQLSHGESTSRYDTPSFLSLTTGEEHKGQSIASAKLQAPKFGAWALEAGGETVFNFVEDSTDYAFNGSALLIPGDATRVEELRNEVFATATWAPKPAFSVEAGVRYEQSAITARGSAGAGDKSLGFLKPRINIAWAPTKNQQLGFRVERTVSQLSFDSFVASAEFNTGIYGAGNPDLEPEKVWTLDARYEYRFDRQGSLVVQYIHEDISDLLGRVVIQLPLGAGGALLPYEITRNVGGGVRDILVVSSNVPLDRYGIAGGAIRFRVQGRRSDTVDPVTSLARSLDGDEPYEFSLNFDHNIVRLKLNWSIGIGGSGATTYYSPRVLSQERASFGMGIGLTWRPDPTLSVSASINNLNRQNHHERYTLFDAPRDTGRPLYTESQVNPGKAVAGFNIRKSF